MPDHLDIDTASLDLVRDYIAEAMGWRNTRTPDSASDGWTRLPDVPGSRVIGLPNHPIRMSLDSAAASLPEGWRWELMFDEDGGSACAWPGDDIGKMEIAGDTVKKDMKPVEALLRVSAKAHAAVRKGAGT